MDTDYTYYSDLVEELQIPKDGILSRILLKNEHVNVTVFGFDAGQELTEHTAATPAIVQIVRGEATLTIGTDKKEVGPGAWLYMPARMPHGVSAKTPVIMLLVLVKSQKVA
ncbi:MAG TPA: cupin domain-containing protein [Chloroflexia bacterium]|nr:cupin domain-containing protein [Chloroflexia bacterium]